MKLCNTWIKFLDLMNRMGEPITSVIIGKLE